MGTSTKRRRPLKLIGGYDGPFVGLHSLLCLVQRGFPLLSGVVVCLGLRKVFVWCRPVKTGTTADFLLREPALPPCCRMGQPNPHHLASVMLPLPKFLCVSTRDNVSDARP
jgi:hypothetical protein